MERMEDLRIITGEDSPPRSPRTQIKKERIKTLRLAHFRDLGDRPYRHDSKKRG
jgi:hypothetical protein